MDSLAAGQMTTALSGLEPGGCAISNLTPVLRFRTRQERRGNVLQDLKGIARKKKVRGFATQLSFGPRNWGETTRIWGVPDFYQGWLACIGFVWSPCPGAQYQCKESTAI